MGNCVSYIKQTSSSRYVDKRKTIPITRFRSVGYVCLHADGTLTNELVPFPAAHPAVDLSNLSGVYAYCLAQSKQGQQYLLVNPLKEYESNHGLFTLFLKRLPEEANIIAAGEIQFFDSTIITWNLKSMGFSQNIGLDESNPHFYENRKRLWLPQAKYQSIAEAKGFVHGFFTEAGSPRLEEKESSELRLT